MGWYSKELDIPEEINRKNVQNEDRFEDISEKIDTVLKKTITPDHSTLILTDDVVPVQDKTYEKTTVFHSPSQKFTPKLKTKKSNPIQKIKKKPRSKRKTGNIDNTSTQQHPKVIKECNTTNLHSFGWKGLGSRDIIYDENRREYIYNVTEPILTDKEQAIKKKLIQLFRMYVDVDVSSMSFQEKRAHLHDILETILHTNKIHLSNEGKHKIYYYLFRDFIGYGKIDILMQDDEIEDISCDGPNIPLFIFHRQKESLRTNIIFDEKEQLDDFVFKLAQMSGKQLSMYEPIIDGKLPDGSRLQTTLGKTVTLGSNFTIRRFSENPLTPIDLIENNTMSLRMAAYFWFIMEQGVSILFCGGTASGKTTLLNALSLFIPSTFKIVSVEDTREINLPHENWIAGTTRQGFTSVDQAKSKHDIDMFDLVRAALRQRPQVIIVGEVRGKEANTMFQAMATGHLSYSTMHADSMQTLIQRLENKPISLPRTLITSLDLVVFIKSINTLEGKLARRINEVIEILKLDSNSDRIITVKPFSWKSQIDDTFEYRANSKILNNIMKLKGWTEQSIYEELYRREQVLTWMMDNNIRSYKEIGRIVFEYAKQPTAIWDKLQEEVL